MEKKIPILYKDKEECCGCAACYASCLQKAIQMKEDEEGFWYPEIEGLKCVCCYKCISVCAIKKKKNN